jgi:hypothetical protein
VVNFITALNSNRLTKQMDSRIALVTWEFFIRLRKRLRYDVFDVWLHKSLKLMKRVTECSGHNKDCRLLAGVFVGLARGEQSLLPTLAATCPRRG